MASTSRSEAQARSRSEAPPRPTSSVFPQHTPDPVNNAISYPNFVRSTLPSTDPAPDANAPLLLIPSKKDQEEDPTLPEEDEPEEPAQADDDTVDGQLFQAARAARASVQPVASDPRAAILRFVEKKEQEAKSGHAIAPIVRGVVARPARKRRKVVDIPVKGQQSAEGNKIKEEGKSGAEDGPVDMKESERVKEEPNPNSRDQPEPVAGAPGHLEWDRAAESQAARTESQAEKLFAYSSSEDDEDEVS